MGASRPPPETGTAEGGKKSGGGLRGWVGKVLDNISVDFNVGAPAAHRAPAGTPTDPAARMEPVRQDRKETYDEMIFRTSDGAEGQAPAVRVDRERQHVARSIDGRAKPSNPDAAIPKGGGEPLAKDVRTKMEPKLGADLSEVRVHRSGQSAEAAHGLNAKAFTVGPDVHFGSGNYQPGTKEGDRLLVHELTHVVQGQRSGIQRKEADGAATGDGANHGHDDATGGEAGAAGGHEVSQPGEPAENEADAVADKVTDDLHAPGADKKQKGKSNDGKGQDKKQGGAGGANHGDATAQGDHASTAEPGDEKAPAEAPKPIAAKLEASVGRKLHRSVSSGDTSTPLVAGKKVFRAPASAAAAASGTAASAAAAPKPNLKTPEDVRKFCAPDPIAMQKLADLDGETNIDPAFGGIAKAKQDFYKNIMDYVNANPAVPANTIFNSCFNSAARDWKFKGAKIAPAAIARICSRTCGLGGWWWDAVNKAPFEAQARGALGPGADADSVSKMAQSLWKERVKDGASLMSSIDRSAAIKPKGQTWYTPDNVQIKSAGDVGFSELMRINALQPEWFPEGTVSFEVSPSAFAGEARKPTAFDGMQSALWVSRPDGDAYGVTGGSAKEFLARDVKCSGILSAKAVIPSADMRAEIQSAMKKAYDNALSMDPMLKQAIDKEKDPKKLEDLKGLAPNLTDQIIRGDLSFGSIPKAIRDLIGDTVKTTALERKQPTNNKNPSGTGKRP
jgi:hypothetical protein